MSRPSLAEKAFLDLTIEVIFKICCRLKYWSCCQHKTTDFNNFLDQEGCQTGKHKWIKTESVHHICWFLNSILRVAFSNNYCFLKDCSKKAACRYDWHQTGSLVVISIYAKGANPEKSFVDANAVKVQVSICFGDNAFNEELILFGVSASLWFLTLQTSSIIFGSFNDAGVFFLKIIDVTRSSVYMAATKIEIKLQKAEFFSWSKLVLPTEAPKDEENPAAV